MDEEARRIIERVQQAFTTARYPGHDRLTDSAGHEPDLVAAEFHGKKDWRALSSSV